jgi:hypothetical protein
VLKYNPDMSRTKIATASVLALAIAVFPAVLNQCAASCAEHHDAVASTPSCHHVTTTANRIGAQPTPCGHDHIGTVVTSANTSAPIGRSTSVMVAVVALPVPLASSASERRLLEHSPPRPALPRDARSLPLRV